MKHYLSFTLIALTSSLLSNAATFDVDKAGSGDFDTVEAAVNAALANDEADEIVIQPGTYVDGSNFGEVLYFAGNDDIVLRGADPADRPVIAVEPNLANSAADNVDGVIIQMGGRLVFEDLIFIPSEGFTLELAVDSLFAVNNAGTDGNPSSLDLTFRNVVITVASEDNIPATLDGFDDPRGALNTFRDDAINIDTNGPPADELTLLLDNVVISGPGTETDSDALVLDGPNIDCTITGGSRFTYPTRRGLYAANASTVTVDGTADNPVIVYGAAETMARASGGAHIWNHLWCVGLNEGPDGISTGFGARIDPNGGATLIANHCIFSTAINDGIFFNFDAESPLSYEFNNCTFHNVPAMLRFGFAGADPGPSENVSATVTDSIVDNFFWTAPNDGTYFAPEPTVLDYGDGDNTTSQVTIRNMAYRTISFVSSRSGANMPVTEGNIIADADFQFASEELTRDTMDDFLVVANCGLLDDRGTGGSPLVGARPSPCGTSVPDWQLR